MANFQKIISEIRAIRGKKIMIPFPTKKMKSDRSTFLLIQSFFFVFRMKPLCQQAQNMGKKDRYQTNLRSVGTKFFSSVSKVLCRP
jgi:hypothetical protein